MEEHFYMTVGLVIIHHQGAGAPSDSLSMLNEARYSIGIGVTRYELRRPPETSFTTAGNRALQVCLSGNRDIHVVADSDIALIRAAVAEARSRGWVTGNPLVAFHGDFDITACPGSNTRARRGEIGTACQAVTAGVPPSTININLGEHPVQKFKWNGNLDPQGFGWFDVPNVLEDRVVGVFAITRGYSDPTPEVSLEYGAPDGRARVQIKNGKPSGNYTIHVSYV